MKTLIEYELFLTNVRKYTLLVLMHDRSYNFKSELYFSVTELA